MKLCFIALLSWRYFKSIYQERASSFLLRMSWASIGLTTLIVALSISLFNGFHHAMHTTMQGINPPFFIEGFTSREQYKQLKKYIGSEHMIKDWTPLWQSYVLLDNESHSLDALCMLQAVDSSSYLDVTCFAKTVLHSNAQHIKDMLADRRIIIGSALAKKYHMSVGDTLCLLYVSCYNDQDKLDFDRIQLTIGAVATTGIEELDAMLVVCDKRVFKELWPEKLPDSIGVTLTNSSYAAALHNTLMHSNNVYSYPWQDLYPSLMSALALEKVALYLFLGLLSFLSSMSIACALLMIINYKRVEFALFYTMGASICDLTLLLGSIGLLITLTSAASGCLLAYTISTIFSHYIVLPLPDAYYVHHLPFDSSCIIFVGVFFFITIISLLSIAWACAQVRTIDPAQTLRFER